MKLTATDIRELRQRLGLTQSDLALLTGAHWVTVSRWERGKLEPTAFQAGLLGKFSVASQVGTDTATNLKDLLAKPGAEGPLLGLYFLLSLAEAAEKRDGPPSIPPGDTKSSMPSAGT